MNKSLLSLVFTAVCLLGYSQSKRETIAFPVGNTKVNIVIEENGQGPTFVNLHDNENTSVDATNELLKKHSGRLIQLVHSGERNVKFKLGKKAYEFDPNRMFTDAGAEATLERFGSNDKSAHKKVRALAERVYGLLDVPVIITLHNNSEDNYSAASYLDDYKNDAAAVYIKPNSDPDDFFFVTTQKLFDACKSRGFNVVLQNNETMTDDGSLSVLAGREGVPYVNVEAQHGHQKEQLKMLEALMEMIKD